MFDPATLWDAHSEPVPQMMRYDWSDTRMLLSDVGLSSGCRPGTMILTKDGELPVEYLVPGDMVITRDRGYAPLVRVERFRRIAHAIRFVLPAERTSASHSQVVLPGFQQVYIRDDRAKVMTGKDSAMIRADALVDGEFITDLGMTKLELYALRFASEHVIYANGLEIASGPAKAAVLRGVA